MGVKAQSEFHLDVQSINSSFRKRAYFAKQNDSPLSGIQLWLPHMLNQSWIPCRGQTFREEARKARPLHGMTGLWEVTD